jgi:hypothetical protein
VNEVHPTHDAFLYFCEVQGVYDMYDRGIRLANTHFLHVVSAYEGVGWGIIIVVHRVWLHIDVE